MLSIVVTPPDGSPLPTASIDQGINLSAFATDLARSGLPMGGSSHGRPGADGGVSWRLGAGGSGGRSPRISDRWFSRGWHSVGGRQPWGRRRRRMVRGVRGRRPARWGHGRQWQTDLPGSAQGSVQANPGGPVVASRWRHHDHDDRHLEGQWQRSNDHSTGPQGRRDWTPPRRPGQRHRRHRRGPRGRHRYQPRPDSERRFHQRLPGRELPAGPRSWPHLPPGGPARGRAGTAILRATVWVLDGSRTCSSTTSIFPAACWSMAM
jgi:hypothetical protein